MNLLNGIEIPSKNLNILLTAAGVTQHHRFLCHEHVSPTVQPSSSIVNKDKKIRTWSNLLKVKLTKNFLQNATVNIFFFGACHFFLLRAFVFCSIVRKPSPTLDFSPWKKLHLVRFKFLVWINLSICLTLVPCVLHVCLSLVSCLFLCLYLPFTEKSWKEAKTNCLLYITCMGFALYLHFFATKLTN